jgi:hypothetical protein
MIEIVPTENISMEGVKILRSLCSQSISEIKAASRNGVPVLSIESFEGDWESNRKILAKVAREYQVSGGVYFFVRTKEAEFDAEFLSPEEYIESLQGLRELELEAQLNSDLEMGYISSPEEFVPHDEEWT